MPEPQESSEPGALVEQRGDWLDESTVNQAGEWYKMNSGRWAGARLCGAKNMVQRQNLFI